MEVLREADRRKDEFLAMLAHELRNPLAPLSHGLEVLNRIGPREPAAQKACQMMSRQVQSLIRLVDDLLDVSRVSQGKIQLQRELIPLRQVVSRAIESSRPFIDERRHQLEVTLPEDPLWIDADPVRVPQVVINLLNNAAKFTPPGGRLAIAIEKAADSPHALVRIRDSGIGISADMMARIFDLFIQADPTVSRAEGGLGIGLTLSRRLVEMHGGSLHAQSAGLGQGSEFVIRFPLSAQAGESGREAGPRAAAPARAKPLRLLIVDDNRDAGESLAVLLRILGHDVRQVFDGQKAVALAAEFVPDVVLLDIGMPGMSGYEVAAELQALPALSHTRLVALTGYGSAEDRTRTREAGFHHHLVKPLELAALEPILLALKNS
jgi:CheY-like chemotaxis protein